MIKTENLTFSYEDSTDLVLDNINLNIEKGSFTAILGHNGSGKSTLAKTFNAILLPSGGKVYVKDMDTANEDRLFDIRRSAGMVFRTQIIRWLRRLLRTRLRLHRKTSA